PLFQGVLPREQVSAAIDQLLKAAVANGIVGRAEPVGPAAEEGGAEEPAADPRFDAAYAAMDRGDFAAARAEFEKLLEATPGDPAALAGKATAGVYERVTRYDPGVVLAAAAGPDATLQTQLDAADVELAQGDAEAAFERLLALIRTSAGDDRDRARVRLLELFETLPPEDPRVLKARRGLMAALF
ncbi:MAG: tetratricopeptide repeat protein, partial [Actinomycetes bacterium]